MWGNDREVGKKKCKKCGAEYTLYSESYSMREKGHIECNCGHVIKSWSAPATFWAKFADGTTGKKFKD